MDEILLGMVAKASQLNLPLVKMRAIRSERPKEKRNVYSTKTKLIAAQYVTEGNCMPKEVHESVSYV